MVLPLVLLPVLLQKAYFSAKIRMFSGIHHASGVSRLPVALFSTCSATHLKCLKKGIILLVFRGRSLVVDSVAQAGLPYRVRGRCRRRDVCARGFRRVFQSATSMDPLLRR